MEKMAMPSNPSTARTAITEPTTTARTIHIHWGRTPTVAPGSWKKCSNGMAMEVMDTRNMAPARMQRIMPKTEL